MIAIDQLSVNFLYSKGNCSIWIGSTAWKPPFCLHWFEREKLFHTAEEHSVKWLPPQFGGWFDQPNLDREFRQRPQYFIKCRLALTSNKLNYRTKKKYEYFMPWSWLLKRLLKEKFILKNADNAPLKCLFIHPSCSIWTGDAVAMIDRIKKTTTQKTPPLLSWGLKNLSLCNFSKVTAILGENFYFQLFICNFRRRQGNILPSTWKS